MDVVKFFRIAHLMLLISCAFGLESKPFLPVVVGSVKNLLTSECSVQDTIALAKKTTKLENPLMVPFISIRNYLSEYTANRPYIPEKALLVKTSLGCFHLWANEQGVVCAPDLKQKALFDEWDPETLCAHGTSEDTARKRSLVVLVLKMLKDKVKIALEPIN